MNYYLVTIRYDLMTDNTPVIDCFYPMIFKGESPKAMRLFLSEVADNDPWERDRQTFNHIKLRTRYDGGIIGPLCIKVNDVELDRDMMQQIIDSKFEQGLDEFRDFIKKASV